MNAAIAVTGRIVAVICAMIAAVGISATGASADPAQGAARSCDVTWRGSANGDWHAAANWKPARVPQSTDVVCILSGSAVLTAGHPGEALILTMRGSGLIVDAVLAVQNKIDINDAALSGSGSIELPSKTISFLQAVEISGGLRLATDANIVVGGQRAMCGGSYALCLRTGSSASAAFFQLAPGSIVMSDQSAGTRLSGGIYLDCLGAGSGSEIVARLSTSNLINDCHGGNGEPAVSLTIDDLVQLSGNGTLGTGDPLDIFAWGWIILSRSVLTNRAQILEASGLTTRSGNSALLQLSRNEGYLSSFYPFTIDGSLTNAASGSMFTLEAYNRPIQFTVTGALRNYGQLEVSPGSSALIGGNVVNAGVLTVIGTLSAASVSQSGGLLMVGQAYEEARITSGPSGTGPINVKAGTVRLLDNGVLEGTVGERGTLDLYSCGSEIDGSYTAAGASALWSAGLSGARTEAHCAALLDVTGLVTLPRYLSLHVDPGGQPIALGDRIVLVNAPAGITGQFAWISGSGYGANHFEISYTATQVVATLVAGPPPAGGGYV